VNHLLTSTPRQHLVHPGFYLGSVLLIVLVFRIVFFYFACLSGVTGGAGTVGKYVVLHYPIALLIAYIIMIGLYIFTNNIQ